MAGFVDSLKTKGKDILLWNVYPKTYRRAARMPIVPGKVVFVEMRAKALSDDARLIYNRLVDDPRFDVHVHLVGESRVGYAQLHRNYQAMVRDIATAECVFLTDSSNVVSCVPLREGTRVVQLWHACGAFKKWGMSTANLVFGGTAEQITRHPHYGNLSLVTVSSPDVVWAYVEAMNLGDHPEIVQPVGVSRTDVFFDEAWLANARSRVEEVVPAARGRKIILYAPTFRGRVATATSPDKLDVEAFCQAVGDDYVLLEKHHPFVKHPPVIPPSCSDVAFDVTNDLPIDVLLAASDLCISDYSSLVFEYALMRRPMAFFCFDREEYSDWRGFYYDLDELTPGPICMTTDELIAWVKDCESGFDSTEVDAFRATFMSACDGHATDRIMRAAFGDNWDAV